MRQLFVKQIGGAQYGHYRSTGVEYCSPLLKGSSPTRIQAKAQGSAKANPTVLRREIANEGRVYKRSRSYSYRFDDPSQPDGSR
jgi:hypothetical protein